MSRFIFKSIASRNSSNNLCRIFIRNVSSESRPQFEQRTPRPEKIQITLCGKVDRPPINKADGPTMFAVKTRIPNTNNYGIHRVLIFHDTLKRIFGNRLQEGDQVYLNGSLKYFEFVTPDDKVRQRANIVANEMHICDRLGDDIDGLFDVNDVKLIGQVVSGPRNTEKATYLDVATRTFNRKEQVYQENCHSLIITDENMRKIVNNLDLGIDVCVHGRIHSRAEKSNEGKSIITVNISPYSLFAIRQ